MLQVVGVGIVAFAIGYLATMMVFFPGWDRDGIVAVPDLRRRAFPEARRVAGRSDLEVERGSTLGHPTVPSGRVLAQTPLPGQEVIRGSSVRVILSGGPESRPIPPLDQLAEADAISIVRRTGFRVRIRRVTSDRPAGRVVAVSPASGSMLRVGGVVDLTLSAGPPLVIVPSITGMPLGAARDALSAVGLRVAEVIYDPASPAPWGEVFAQAPAASAATRGGSRVTLTVSGYPPVESAPEEVAPDSGLAPPLPPEG